MPVCYLIHQPYKTIHRERSWNRYRSAVLEYHNYINIVDISNVVKYLSSDKPFNSVRTRLNTLERFVSYFKYLLNE